MSEVARVDDDTMKFGLLMESAQAHQRLADEHLDKLRAHTQDLDAVVRDEIRRTLSEELTALTVESERVARALRKMYRAAGMRGLCWNLSIAVFCTVIPCAIVRAVLPSESAVAALRAQRDLLAESITQLEQRGGKVEWRKCGDFARLCIRVDRKAPLYGDASDYVIVKGY